MRTVAILPIKSFGEAKRSQPTLAWAWNDSGFALQVRAIAVRYAESRQLERIAFARQQIRRGDAGACIPCLAHERGRLGSEVGGLSKRIGEARHRAPGHLLQH